MNWINFRHLYAFWMVCKCSGFKNAAERMRVSQSAVSEQVKQLEEYLGQELLRRSTRSIHLTPMGAEVLSQAEVIFEKSREINQSIRDGLHVAAPTISKVGVVGGVSRNFLYRMISDYLGDESAAKVSVLSGSYEELNRLLKRHDLDVIITLELPHKEDLEALSYRKIAQSRLCLAGKKRIISQVRSGRSKKTLDLFKFRYPYEGDLVEDVLHRQAKIRINQRLDTDDIPLLRFFATSGNGVVLIPEIGIQDDLTAGALERIVLKQLPEIAVYGIFLKRRLHREAISRFLREVGD